MTNNTNTPGTAVAKRNTPAKGSAKVTKGTGPVGVETAAKKFASTFDAFGDLMLTRCVIVGDLIANNSPAVSANQTILALETAVGKVAGAGRSGWKRANLERYAAVYSLLKSRNLPLTGEVVHTAYTVLDGDREGFRALKSAPGMTPAKFTAKLNTAAKVAEGKRGAKGATAKGLRTKQTAAAYVASLEESILKRAEGMATDELATLAKGLRAITAKVAKVKGTAPVGSD